MKGLINYLLLLITFTSNQVVFSQDVNASYDIVATDITGNTITRTVNYKISDKLLDVSTLKVSTFNGSSLTTVSAPAGAAVPKIYLKTKNELGVEKRFSARVDGSFDIVTANFTSLEITVDEFHLIGSPNNFPSGKQEIYTISGLSPIVVDPLAPVITTSISANLRQRGINGKGNVRREIRITDNENTQTSIYSNGEKVLDTNLKYILNNIPVKEGVNSIRIESVNSLGKSKSITYENIFVDSYAPEVFLTQTGNITVNDPEFTINGFITDARPRTYAVYLNGVKIRSTNLFFDDADIIDFTMTLAEGKNLIRVEGIDDFNNKTDYILDNVYYYPEGAPTIVYNSAAGVNTSELSYRIDAEILGNGIIATEVFQNDDSVYNTTDRNVSFNVFLEEGVNSFKLVAINEDGLTSEVSLSDVVLDRNAPVVQVTSIMDETVANSNFSLDFIVSDDNITVTNIFLNNSLLSTTSEKNVVFKTLLTEGENIFRIESTDLALNKTVVSLSGVNLDTTPPVLSNLLPTAGSTVDSLVVKVSGISNEPLSRLLVNGVEVSLGGVDQLSFSKNVIESTDGDYAFSVTATDLSGNTSSINIPFKIDTRLFIESLISVSPSNGQLKIKGVAGAAASGILINAKLGLFSNFETTSLEDGSFELVTDFFETAELIGTKTDTGRTEKITLKSEIKTTLAGAVYSTDDSGSIPIEGVKVMIASSGQVGYTDKYGAFVINNPITGDQRIIFDASTSNTFSDGRKYAPVAVERYIGNLEPNVLDRITYLNHIPQDGTQTMILADQAKTVTSPKAEGVELTIPAGKAVFPDGGNSGEVFIRYLTPEKMIHNLPDRIIPSRVLALEPSGMEFTEPVDLVLPNENELPAGTEMLIISRNSKTGEWYPDGAALVTDDGSSVKTKEGMGITHFSEIIAVPIAPFIRELEDGRSFAQNAEGSLTKKVALPSFKVMGKSITPELSYNSKWASPVEVIQNTFNVPREKIAFNTFVNQETYLADIEQTLRYGVRIEGQTWFEPEYVKFQFKSRDIESEQIEFQNVKNQSLVTYAMDVSSLESGSHPYYTDFEIGLKQMQMYTATVDFIYKYRTWYGKKKQQRIFEVEDVPAKEVGKQLLPQRYYGLLHVQNRINSEWGQGWKSNFSESIFSQNDSKVFIEEKDGSVSSYSVDVNVENIFFNNKFMASYNRDSNGSVIYTTRAGQVYKNTTGRFQDDIIVGTEPALIGTALAGGTSCPTNPSVCIYRFDSYIFDDMESGIVATSDSNQFYTAGKTGRFFNIDTNNGIPVSLINPQNFVNAASVSPSAFYAMYPDAVLFRQGSPFTTGNPPPPTGKYPKKGFKDGSIDVAEFNNVSHVIEGFEPNTLLLADTGNSRIRKIDLNMQTVTTIAGNGSSTDSGDGGFAINAGLFKPIALAKSNSGDLFVLSEKGLVRRLDTSGRITLVVDANVEGNNFPDLSEEVSFNELTFNSPKSIAYDHERNLIYISDNGRQRIVRLNLDEETATTVAANSASTSCSTTILSDDTFQSLDAALCEPTQLSIEENGNLVFLDRNIIRRINFNYQDNARLVFTSDAQDLSTLSRGNDNSWTRIFRNNYTKHYSKDGLLIEEIDPSGNSTLYEYNNEKQIDLITYPSGEKLDYEYQNGILDHVQDPSGRITRFIHDGKLLQTVEYSDQSTMEFEYDAKGVMTASLDQNQNRSEYVWNQYQGLESTVMKNAKGDVVYSSDQASSQNLANKYDGTNPLDFLSQGLNGGSLADKLVDANGNTSRVDTNVFGQIVAIEDAKGRRTEVLYNDDGDVERVIRGDGTEAVMVIDPITKDLLSSEEITSGATDVFTYDEFGNTKSHINTYKNIDLKNYYNDFNLLEKQVNSNNIESFRTYFPNGRLKQIHDKNLEGVEYEYDSFLRVSKAKTIPTGPFVTYEYDAAGNVIKTTSSQGISVEYQYDDFNRIIQVRNGVTDLEPIGLVTLYDYDDNGNLISVIDPSGEEEILEYDFLNRVVKRINKIGKVWEYSYDGNGNTKTYQTPDGIVAEYFYDELNQPISKVLPDNIYNYRYDDNNNLKSISNNFATIDYSYLNIGGEFYLSNMKSTSSFIPAYDINYAYDNNQRISSFSGTRGGSVFAGNTYTYDADRLSEINNLRGESFNYNYRADNGRLDNITRSSGFNTQFKYDQRGLLSELNHLKLNQNAITSQLFFDDAGRIDKITKTFNSSGYSIPGVSGGDFNFSTDAQDQLLSTTNPEVGSVANESFSYDSSYNRVSDSNGTFTYDDKRQRLIEDYKFQYTYDGRGNLTSKLEKGLNGNFSNYIYNSENRLIEVKRFVSNVQISQTEFIYDPLGRRIVKKHTDLQNSSLSKTKKYFYNQNNVIAELDEADKIIVKYTNSGLSTDDILSFEVTQEGENDGVGTKGLYTVLKDHIGSITDIVNESQTVVQHYSYSAYGKILKVVNSLGQDITDNLAIKIDSAFAGREWDREVDLYYNRARFYDPSNGRFLGEDPEFGQLASPITLVNKYIYAGNNPIVNVDPSGRSFWKKVRDIGIGFALGNINGVFAAINISGRFSSAEKRLANVIYVAATVGSVSGGLLAGPAAGAGATAAGSYAAKFSALILGKAIGGITGGLAGGLTSVALGGDFRSGFEIGFSVGAIAGGLTAGFTWRSSFVKNGGGFSKLPTKLYQIVNKIGCGVALGFAGGGLIAGGVAGGLLGSTSLVAFSIVTGGLGGLAIGGAIGIYYFFKPIIKECAGAPVA